MLRQTFLLAVIASTAVAQTRVPLVINHQGRLLSGADAPFSGTVELTFELHETDNQSLHAPKWSETRSVTIVNGGYSLLLGDTREGAGGTALDVALLGQEQLYFSVTIDGKELLPRTRIASVPYALRAGRAATAEAVLPGGVDAAAIKDGAVTTEKVAAGAITAEKLGNASVTGPAIADGAITLEKLALAGGRFAGLDADKLDGLDSSAFAPAAIEGTIGTPPSGSSIAGEIAGIRSALDALATTTSDTKGLAGETKTLASDTKTLASDTKTLASDTKTLASDTKALATGVKGVTDDIKASLGVVSGVTVAARADAAATAAAAANTKLGTPAAASVSADIAALRADIATLATALTAKRDPAYSRTCVDDPNDADGWRKTGWASQQECYRDGKLHFAGAWTPGASCAADVGKVLQVMKAGKLWGLNVFLHLNDNNSYIRGFGSPHVNATDNPFKQTGEVYFWNGSGGVYAHVSNGNDTCIDAANCAIPTCSWWGGHSEGSVWVSSAGLP